MDVSEGAVQAALARLEQLVEFGESVRGSDVTVPTPRLVPLAMAANGALEMLAALDLCPADQLAGFRSRLVRLGIEPSTGTPPRTVSGGRGSFAVASPTPPRAQGGTGGPTSVSEWMRQQAGRSRARLLPPTDEVPVVLPLSLVLGRSDTVAVFLVHATVYSTGVSWALWTHGRGEHPPFFPTMAAHAERMGLPVATLPHLTMTFDDGRSSVTVDQFGSRTGAERQPDEVVVVVNGGNGNNDLLRRDLWLTPRPTGSVTIDFAWPEHGLDATRHIVAVPSVVSSTDVWA